MKLGKISQQFMILPRLYTIKKHVVKWYSLFQNYKNYKERVKMINW